MTQAIVNLNQLLALPQASLAPQFGLKTAGVVQLMAMRAGSPMTYRVPPGFAIVANRHRDVSTAELRAAFDSLIAGGGEHGALLARSSSLAEESGQGKTLFVGYERVASEQTFEQFRDAVHEVGESASDMGILLMPMVHGKPERVEDRIALGTTNASFVADTHHPLTPDEMFFSVVSGLGTRAVGSNSDFIPITADRTTGKITSFINKTDELLLQMSFSECPVFQKEFYRQQLLDRFSLPGNRIESIPVIDPLSGGLLRHILLPYMLIEKGAIRVYNRAKDCCENDDEIVNLGATPFGTPQAVMNLISVLQYLAKGSATPIQIEGAFADPSDTIPFLYQQIDVPQAPTSEDVVDFSGADLGSIQVIGVCDFRGPLVRCSTSSLFKLFPRGARELEEIDKTYAEEGYILLAPCHIADIITRTPHCRVRLSTGIENLSSHAVTYTRSLLARDKGTQRALAAYVQLSDRMRVLSGTPRQDIVHLLAPHAHVLSNGRKLRVDLP